MIDFVKCNISYLSKEQLIGNPLLEFWDKRSLETGEIKLPAISKFGYDGFQIEVKEKRIVLSGSLHTLFNVLVGNGETNHTDFDVFQLAAVTHYIEEKLGLDLSKTILQNLEYSINAITKEDPTVIVENKTILWDGRKYSHRKDHAKKGYFQEWKSGARFIKNYDKGRHKEQSENIWRWEVKLMTNRECVRLGLNSMADLLYSENLERLGKSLVNEFDKTIIVDTLKPLDKMTQREAKIYQKGVIRDEWTAFVGKDSKYRFRRNFLNIIKKYELNKLQKELLNLIIDKWQFLQNRDDYITFDYLLKDKNRHDYIRSDYLLKSKNFHEITTFNFLLKRNIGESDEEILANDNVTVWRDKNGQILVKIEPSEKLKTATITYHNIVCNRRANPPLCTITEIDISNQRKGSKYVSQKTVLEILQTGGEKANELRFTYLPQWRAKESLERQAYFIAHNVRNLKSNAHQRVKTGRFKIEEIFNSNNSNSNFIIDKKEVLKVPATVGAGR